MKMLILVVLLASSLQAFAQSQSNAYSCEFKATIASDSFLENFDLGTEIGFVNFDKEINGSTHHYDLIIFEHAERVQFQFMEGHLINGSFMATNSFSFDVLPEQEKFHASTFICNSDISCWSISCAKKDN